MKSNKKANFTNFEYYDNFTKKGWRNNNNNFFDIIFFKGEFLKHTKIQLTNKYILLHETASQTIRVPSKKMDIRKN